MATNFHKVIKERYTLPDENSSHEQWDKFLEAERTPVKQVDIDNLKKIIDLYDKKIQNNKKKRGKDYKLTDGDRNLATMRCEAVYHLAHMEVRQKRQNKMNELFDKLDIDWGAVARDMNKRCK